MLHADSRHVTVFAHGETKCAAPILRRSLANRQVGKIKREIESYAKGAKVVGIKEEDFFHELTNSQQGDFSRIGVILKSLNFFTGQCFGIVEKAFFFQEAMSP